MSREMSRWPQVELSDTPHHGTHPLRALGKGRGWTDVSGRISKATRVASPDPARCFVYISSVKTVMVSGWSWSASLQLLLRLKH